MSRTTLYCHRRQSNTCWKDILELRRSQLAAYAPPASQLALFEDRLYEDQPACRQPARHQVVTCNQASLR
jgi:hypothetical protein